MHVPRLHQPLPLPASAPVESRLLRKKQDDDPDRVEPIGEDDAAREERRRRQAWLDAALEKLDEEGPPTEADETYRASSAPTLPDGSVPTPPPAEPAVAPESALDQLLAGINAEPATEHAEMSTEPTPSLNELLSHILEKPEEK